MIAFDKAANVGVQSGTTSPLATATSTTTNLFKRVGHAVTLRNVDQATPIGDTSSNAATTANPIQVAAALNVTSGDLVLVGATAGAAGSYTPGAGYTEGTDQAAASSTTATAYLSIASTGTEQPSITFDDTINRQVITDTVINRA